MIRRLNLQTYKVNDLVCGFPGMSISGDSFLALGRAFKPLPIYSPVGPDLAVLLTEFSMTFSTEVGEETRVAYVYAILVDGGGKPSTLRGLSNVFATYYPLITPAIICVNV